MARRRSRLPLTLGALVIVAAALTTAFWPQPVQVDMGFHRDGWYVPSVDLANGVYPLGMIVFADIQP